MRIEDETRQRWIVQKGDPGWDAVSLLKSRGFEYVVLLTPILVGGDVDDFELIGTEEDMIDDQHWMRLNDCMLVLKRELYSKEGAIGDKEVSGEV